MPSRDVKPKNTKYYEYSKDNINSFYKDLTTKIPQLKASSNFSEFTDLFQETLDKHCKLIKPKITKRTVSNNPWITESLIQAIERKHELKRQWSKTTSKKCPTG